MDTEQDKNTEGQEHEEDLVWEEEGETGSDKIKKLREKLTACQKERDEYLGGWQRAKADYVNARKEDERNRSEFIKLANKEILLDMIAVADSFDQAQANKEAWEKVDKNWRVGVEYIISQLLSTFEKHGLKQIDPLGEKFNPSEHTSVGTVPAKDASEDENITVVVQKGYMLHDALIRSPKVEVAIWGEK